MKKLLISILLFALPLPLAAGVIEGRVVRDDQPVAGVTVQAFAGFDFTVAPVAVAAPSTEDGSFRLEVPPGSYALFGWSADRTLFAFCGRSPVTVAADGKALWAGLQAVPVTPPQRAAYADPYSAAIEGRVLLAGKPMAEAHVYLYLDPDEDLKGQGYRMSAPTDADGYFAFDGLPESHYFIAVRKRQDGQKVGPVREGDLYGIYPGNPLMAHAGTTAGITMHLAAKLKDAVEAETFGRGGGPELRGTVIDSSGRGVAGIHVFAYTDRVIGHQRPAALSTPTGPDGAFVVLLPAPGTYYVGARELYGDSPAPGELFGMFEESADHGLTVKAGEKPVELKIVVEPIRL
ncbi:MAG: carboxypeptidase-like regulatory domain-containing protein [Desulfuromonadales bacterium]